MMSMGPKLLYILLLAEFSLICLGTENEEPDDDITPKQSYNRNDLEDTVSVSSDIYRKCCNPTNTFIRRNGSILPLCDDELLVKENHLHMWKLQKCHNIFTLAREYRLRSRSNNSFMPAMFAEATRQAVVPRVQSNECHFLSLTPSLGGVYGNCSDEFDIGCVGVCVGGCGPVIRHRILTTGDPICKEERKIVNCQMQSGEMKRTMIKSCQCIA